MGIPLTLSSCAAQPTNSQKEPVVHLSVVEGAEASGKQYSAKVFRDGTAEYEGFPNANVKVRGTVSYKLPQAEVDEIVKRLRQSRLENVPSESRVLTMTKAFAVLVVNLDGDGNERRFQISRDRLDLMELFRDLQNLLKTEQFRCPYQIKDYGPPFGVVDRCKFDEAVLAVTINELKKNPQNIK